MAQSQANDNTRAMEHIWKQVAKKEEGGQEFIHYTGVAELNFLYFTGFVNTQKYTLQEWQKAFDDSRQSNGSYRVTKDQWMAKQAFRYNGPVGRPFKPLDDLQEREYNETEIVDVLKNKIVPSTSVDEKTILGYVNHYKSRGMLVNGKMKVDKSLKRDIHTLLEMYPSPLRVLQINVQKMREQQAGVGKEKAAAADLAATQSQFMANQRQDKVAAAQLASILKSGQAAAPGPRPPTTSPVEQGLSLKDLQRSRMKTRKI